MEFAMELDVVIHRDDETGGLWAQVLQLPGCFAAGHSMEELEASLEEAVSLYLEENDPTPATDHVEGLRRYRLEDRRLIPA